MMERYGVKPLISGILLQAAKATDIMTLEREIQPQCCSDVMCATHGCPAVKDGTHSHLHCSVCQNETIHTRSPEVAVSTLIPQKEML
jgi:hypothetical protein